MNMPYSEDELKWKNPNDGRRAKRSGGYDTECTEEEIREYLKWRGPEIARKADEIIEREQRRWVEMTEDEREQHRKTTLALYYSKRKRNRLERQRKSREN